MIETQVKLTEQNQQALIEISRVTGKSQQELMASAIEEFIKSYQQKKGLHLIQTEEVEEDPDDTPIEEIKASLRRALQEVKEGKTLPISQMWEGINVE